MSKSIVPIFLIVLLSLPLFSKAAELPLLIQDFVKSESKRVGKKLDDVSTLEAVYIEDGNVIFIYDNVPGFLPPKSMVPKFESWLKRQLCAPENRVELAVLEAIKANRVSIVSKYKEQGQVKLNVITSCW